MMNLKVYLPAGALAAAILVSTPSFVQSAAQQVPTNVQPADCPPEGFSGGFTKGCPQKQFANPADISAMMAALPDKPYAKPKSLRRVLVLCRATTFVHSSIPLAAKMVEYLGDRTGAWMTTITYDAASITPDNLRQYDALFLDSTTGEFLDDPNDKAVTEIRKRALIDFVKGGRGLAGIHAASDAYHTTGRPATPGGPPTPLTGTWPEFNEMIGGFFKFHWSYPTLISVKIDDPDSPLTVMFPRGGYEIVDETYTFAQDSFSRKRVHVLTSVNYQRMSAEDKAKEPAATRRTDGDYALSYIQRVGNGRVFYEAHGHDERVYFQRPFVAHMLAGIQYALGDLAADDSPSVK
ncbi:MAG TPA: ThuA domain-containing protein [Blastocatellia bacterium]